MTTTTSTLDQIRAREFPRTDYLSADAVKALREFLDLPAEQYLEVWKTLPAPRFGEVDGEYEKTFGPNYNDVEWAMLSQGLYNVNRPMGGYLRKGFQPQTQVTGEGYNAWVLPAGTEQRRGRFGTHLGTSLVDAKPSLNCTYSSFNRSTAWKMDEVLELRKLDDGVFIVVTTANLANAIEMGHAWLDVCRSYGVEISQNPSPIDRTPALPGVFVLTGPICEAVGVDDREAEDQ